MDLQNTLVELLAAILDIGLKELDKETDLREFGLDSFSLTEYAEQIKARLGVDVNATLLFEYTTIKDISDYLHKHYPVQPGAYSERGNQATPDNDETPIAESSCAFASDSVFQGNRSDFPSPLTGVGFLSPPFVKGG